MSFVVRNTEQVYEAIVLGHILYMLVYKPTLSQAYPNSRCPKLVCSFNKIVVHEIIHKIILQKLF